MAQMTTSTNFSSWWGRQTIEPNRIGLWQLGPLTLWVQHLTQQWRLSWKSGGDWLDPSIRILPSAGSELPPLDASQVRCVFGSSPRQDLLFAPALADRSIVTRLETPLHVLPKETVTLYVLSPLNLRVEMIEPSKLLQEIPSYRLSDTWFGPMSSAGELAYASTVPAFLDLREVPLRLHCAITAVTIRNSGSDSLRLERINVPLPRLSLFYSARTGFWTDSFSLERDADNEMAAIRLDRQPPPEASPSQFVAGPRKASSEANPVVRAFSALFREGNFL
jgi:hypothetical protein